MILAESSVELISKGSSWAQERISDRVKTSIRLLSFIVLWLLVATTDRLKSLGLVLYVEQGVKRTLHGKARHAVKYSAAAERPLQQKKFRSSISSFIICGISVQ